MDTKEYNHELDEKKSNLKLELEFAFDWRVKESKNNLQRGQLPTVDPIRCVFVNKQDQQELYLWLLQEAYKLAGKDEDSAKELAIEDFEHEIDHGSAAKEGITVEYGVRFFDVTDDNGSPIAIGVQAFTLIFGVVSSEEKKAIHSAPKELSSIDLKNLSDIDSEN